VSFEPAQQQFAELSRRIVDDASWSAHRLALGSDAGEATLHVYGQTQLNSVLSAREAGERGVDDHPIGTEQVRVVRLDDVASDLLPPAGRALLKVDAQGFDLEVLKGAERTLARCVALQVEVSGLPIYRGVPPLHEVVRHLYERHFRLTGLYPIMRSPLDRIQIVDFDATFVRVPIDGSTH
jgi:FkbM family methyltransferase